MQGWSVSMTILTWAAAEVSQASNQLPAPDLQFFINPLLLGSAVFHKMSAVMLPFQACHLCWRPSFIFTWLVIDQFQSHVSTSFTS